VSTGVTTKLTISVPDDIAAEAREAVRTGRAASVSGYIAAAVDYYRQQQTLGEFLDELDAELGPPSPEDYARACTVLGVDSGAEAKSA
jgi:Arc/MetJ-type ribon-helix-helix transcriptional regulator